MGIVITFPKPFIQRLISRGDRVVHPNFGKGVVVEIEETMWAGEWMRLLTVNFGKKGLKLLRDSYVQRERA